MKYREFWIAKFEPPGFKPSYVVNEGGPVYAEPEGIHVIEYQAYSDAVNSHESLESKYADRIRALEAQVRVLEEALQQIAAYDDGCSDFVASEALKRVEELKLKGY